MRTKKNENDYPKYTTLSDFGSHVGACCLIGSRCGAFCLRSVFRNLWGGDPLGPISASSGAPLVRCSCLFGRIEQQICSKYQRFQSSISIHRKRMVPTTPSNKQASIKKYIPIINSNTSWRRSVSYEYTLDYSPTEDTSNAGSTYSRGAKLLRDSKLRNGGGNGSHCRTTASASALPNKLRNAKLRHGGTIVRCQIALCQVAENLLSFPTKLICLSPANWFPSPTHPFSSCTREAPCP